MRIRTLVSIFVILFSARVFAQGDNDRAKQALEVRRAVEQSTADGKVRVKGVRYDLRLFDREVIFVDGRSFILRPRNSKIAKTIVMPYEQVIELTINGTTLSFFPDPDQKPFAEWSAVKTLSHGDSVDIDLVDKEQLFGALLKISDSDLTIMQGNETLVINREKIARILLARRDTPEAKKVLKGAGKAASSVGKGGGSGTGAAIVHGAIILGATAAGALGALAKRFPNDRLLIYSR